MLEDAIDHIYEAALVPETWPDAFARLAALAGGVSSAFVLYNGDEQPRFRAPPLLEPALRLFTTSDAWKQSMRVSSLNSPMMRELSHRWVCADEFQTPEELRRDPVQLVLRSLGLGAQAGTAVTMTTGEIVAFSVERLEEDGQFPADALARLGIVRPHLARAGLIVAHLREERANATVALMERLGLPAAVLSARGRVLATNKLLDSLPHIFRARAGGGLALPTQAANDLLGLACSQITRDVDAPSPSIPLPSIGGSEPMVAQILPLRRSAHDIFAGGDVLLAATSATGGAHAPSSQILEELFDLAPAEARLAVELASGKALKTIAAEQGIQFSSARTYLAQIFRKTGTHRQGELVSLLKNTQGLGS